MQVDRARKDIVKDPPDGRARVMLREHFPTPAAVATASLGELQHLATQTQSIGVKDTARLRGLLFEQKQLIKELHLILEHLEQLETEFTQVIETCREGQILTSIPGIGPCPQPLSLP